MFVCCLLRFATCKHNLACIYVKHLRCLLFSVASPCSPLADFRYVSGMFPFCFSLRLLRFSCYVGHKHHKAFTRHHKPTNITNTIVRIVQAPDDTQPMCSCICSFVVSCRLALETVLALYTSCLLETFGYALPHIPRYDSQ